MSEIRPIDRAAPLDLMLSLMQSLSHKIRTPLSVISNDLHYFQTLIDPSETERGILKCRQISDYFKPVQLLRRSDSEQEVFNLVSLLREIFGASLQSEFADIQCQGVKSNLQQALKWISELFSIEHVCFLPEKRLLVCKLSKIIFSGGKDYPALKNTSITEVYEACTGEESLLPVLIDAVLFSFSAECKILNEKEFGIIFTER